jgi:hypothetical protein
MYTVYKCELQICGHSVCVTSNCLRKAGRDTTALTWAIVSRSATPASWLSGPNAETST